MQADSICREQHRRAQHVPAGFMANNPHKEVTRFPTPSFAKAGAGGALKGWTQDCHPHLH